MDSGNISHVLFTEYRQQFVFRHHFPPHISMHNTAVLDQSSLPVAQDKPEERNVILERIEDETPDEAIAIISTISPTDVESPTMPVFVMLPITISVSISASENFPAVRFGTRRRSRKTAK